jgi:hypothetical protein
VSLHQYCSGWKAEYKVWTIKGKTILVDIDVDIPDTQIMCLLPKSTNSFAGQKLFLPATLSADLQQAVILQSIVRILPSRSSSVGEDVPKYIIHSVETGRMLSTTKCVHMLFSPSAKHLAICLGQVLKGGFLEGLLMVWHDAGQSWEDPNFRLLGERVSHNFLDSKGEKSKNFDFHPHLPLLVFGGKYGTFVWHLESDCKFSIDR